MSFITATLRRLGTGFVYGVGFAVGIGAAFNLIGRFSDPITVASSSQPQADMLAKARVPQAVEIVSSEAVVSPYVINVIGTLKNTSPIPISHINLLADLHDKDGRFIFQCKSWVSEVVQAGATTTFSIDCHGVGKELWQRFATHTVRANA